MMLDTLFMMWFDVGWWSA